MDTATFNIIRSYVFLITINSLGGVIGTVVGSTVDSAYAISKYSKNGPYIRIAVTNGSPQHFLIPQLVLDAFYARINLQEFAHYMINTIKKIDDAEYFLVVGDTGNDIYDKHLMSNFGRIYGLKSRIMFKTQGNNMYNPIFALNASVGQLSLIAKSGITRNENTANLINILLQELLGGPILDTILGEQWNAPFKGLLRINEVNTIGMTVSNLGRVKMNGNFMELSFKNGYIVVHIGGAYIGVHRLVASTFVTTEDRDNRVFVNHKSEIKHDNQVVNLENNEYKKPPHYNITRKIPALF